MSQNIKRADKALQIAYFQYAKSVIEDRALPDVNDGHKPGNRRILYCMWISGVRYTDRFRKSGSTVGKVIGDYHPHGDAAAYAALVRMAQSWNYRVPLIEGQGNFGSIDGDPPAAQRYTEAKLSAYSSEFFSDLAIANMVPNYDGTLTEPTTLPSKAPNLLINGAHGIAVGISTSIPPHNLQEVCEAAKAFLYNDQLTTAELMQYIQGPDFPTGGIVADYESIYQAYETGESGVIIRSRYFFEENKIIFTEIPYMTTKSAIVKSIAENIKLGKIKASSVFDDSDKNGIRIIVRCRNDIPKEFILEQIYAFTALRIRFRYCFFALNEQGHPQIYTLRSYLKTFLKHRDNVIIARTIAEMEHFKRKIHILLGQYIVFENLDDIINLIKSANDINKLKEDLQSTQWKCEKLKHFLDILKLPVQDFKLSTEQVKYILEMKLSNLTRLEQGKIEDELLILRKGVEKNNYILNSEEERKRIIEQELNLLITKYSTPRISEIAKEYKILSQRELVEPEDVLIVLDEKNYIKRVKLTDYKLQNRGGKGRIGHSNVACNIIAHTHSQILFFVSNGKVYSLYCYELPEGDHTNKGRALINVLQLQGGEEVINFLVISEEEVENADQYSVLFMSNSGLVRRNLLEEFISIRSNGKIYVEKDLLNEGHKIVSINIANNSDYLMLATRNGMASVAQVSSYRVMNTRKSLGVIGCRLNKNDVVISAAICQSVDRYILTVTANGYGKLSKLEEYRITNRGSKGVINLKSNKKTGPVIAVLSIDINDEILLLSASGQTIKISCSQIRITGRAAQGVILCKLDKEVISVSIC